MTAILIRRLRAGAWVSLVLLLSSATWWYVRWGILIPAQAARAFARAPLFVIEPHSHFQYFVHLFPQVVITEDPVAAFVRDYPLEWASPPVGRGTTVLQYFHIVKGALERYHVQFGTYPDPGHFPPINDEEKPDFWPSMEAASCRYIRLDKDSFLLGWAGPDGQWTDLNEVLRVLDRPYGLRVIGDDWWVRCRYFDFAAYRRHYPKLAKDIILEPDHAQTSWELFDRVLQAKGITFQQGRQPLQGTRFDLDLNFLNWLVLLYQPMSLVLLGGIALASMFLVFTRESGESENRGRENRGRKNGDGSIY